MNSLVNLLVRPDRDEYTLEDLGPEIFYLNNEVYLRKDMEIINNRGFKLKCSWFMSAKKDKMMP